MARLSALRARGPPNIEYELSLLAHVHTNGGNNAVGMGDAIQLALPMRCGSFLLTTVSACYSTCIFQLEEDNRSYSLHRTQGWTTTGCFC